MSHLDTLTRLLPPVAYAPQGAGVRAELAAAAALLDDAELLVHALATELDPQTTYTLLEDFERTFGLPDLCLDLETSTVQERRFAVMQALVARGGQTPAYFETIARALGYSDAVVKEYAQWTCTSLCTDPLAGPDWRHVWAIESSDTERITYFNCTSPCNEPLANWAAIESLSCVINRLKPAHTLCYFDFGA